VEPERFVAERKALAKKLRDEGRADDADAVAALKKPSSVVFAVNRAARDRPKAAQAAASAAVRLRKAQVGGDGDAFQGAAAELDDSLDLLAEVALAHAGSKPTDATRRRLRDLLRSAVADDDAREALVRGALTEELEATGFSAYAGMSVAPRKRPATKHQDDEKQRRLEQRKAIESELENAESELQEATKVARAAETTREHAEKRVASLRAELDNLG
jgi:hypothetical protein